MASLTSLEVIKIAGTIADKVISKAIVNPNIAVSTASSGEVPSSTPGSLDTNPPTIHMTEDVKREIIDEISGVIVNQTNSEPWYKSRILVTQYVTLAGSVATLIGITVEPELKETIVTTVLAAGVVITSLITIWARIKAKLPLSWFSR